MEFCDECAAEYHQKMGDRVAILSDDPVDTVYTPVAPLTPQEWAEQFLLPAMKRRVATCGYCPGDRVEVMCDRKSKTGMVIDVYPTREDIVVVVDYVNGMGVPAIYRSRYGSGLSHPF
jgi:hypothetical protein